MSYQPYHGKPHCPFPLAAIDPSLKFRFFSMSSCISETANAQFNHKPAISLAGIQLSMSGNIVSNNFCLPSQKHENSFIYPITLYNSLDYFLYNNPNIKRSRKNKYNSETCKYFSDILK